MAVLLEGVTSQVRDLLAFELEQTVVKAPTDLQGLPLERSPQGWVLVEVT